MSFTEIKACKDMFEVQQILADVRLIISYFFILNDYTYTLGQIGMYYFLFWLMLRLRNQKSYLE